VRRKRHGSTSLAALLEANVEAADTHDGRTLLAFEVGGARYAVDAMQVEVVAASRFVARTPTGPPELLGVASVHGRMRLVVDLARAAHRSENTKWWLVVLHGDTQLALVADRIGGLHTVAADEACEPGGVVRCGGIDARLLDPERILEV
jgi:chemotaxis signal transduction protein